MVCCPELSLAMYTCAVEQPSRAYTNIQVSSSIIIDDASQLGEKISKVFRDAS